MQVRRVTAARGWRWVSHSIELFARNPLTWIVLNLVLLFIGSALMLIPMVGALLFALLTPVFVGGLMFGCRDADAGGRVQLTHLFRGFQHNAAALVSVGGVYVVGQILVAGVLMYVGGTELQTLMKAAMDDQVARAQPPTVSDRVAVAALLAAALFVPLAMAVWFAPILAALDDLPASRAIQLSLQGCLRNLRAMAVYALAMGSLLLGVLFVIRMALALVPPAMSFVRAPAAMLAMTCWVSLTLISAYVSYRDIFVSDTTQATDRGRPST